MGDARRPHEHSSAAGAPGASGPGERGYDGEVSVGDDALEGSLDLDPASGAGAVPEHPDDPPPEFRPTGETVDRVLEGPTDRA